MQFIFKKFILLRIPPSFAFTLATISGISFKFENLYFTILLFLLSILTILNFTRHLLTINFLIIINLFFFFLSFFRISYLISNYENSLQLLTQNNIYCSGKVIDLENSDNNFFSQAITMQINEVEQQNSKINCNCFIKIYVPKKESINNIEIGDTIKIYNLKIKKTSNKNLKLYLFKQNLIATTFQQTLKFTHLSKSNLNLKSITNKFKNKINQELNKKMTLKTWSLFNTIFLGKKISNEAYNFIKNYFNYWGISHYLARSGLHIFFAIIIWNFILSLFQIPYFLKNILISAIIIIYNSLSWTSISFSRAFITFLLYKYCSLQGFAINSLHIISLACLFFLIYNPFLLFSLDFQLTFSLAFCLAIYNEQKNLKTILNHKTVED